MRANVKRFSRREKALERFKRHLEIERTFAAHNFATDELLRSFVHHPILASGMLLIRRNENVFVWELLE